MHTRIRIAAVGAVLAICIVAPRAQVPLGTAITYQGRLTDAGVPASGSYDLQFALFDAATGGAQQGAVVTQNSVTVTAGVFTVSLDFLAGVFAGDARWLEVGVRPGGASGAFTILAPRQPLSPAPHSIYAATAATATTATTATDATQLAGQRPTYYLTSPLMRGRSVSRKAEPALFPRPLRAPTSPRRRTARTATSHR